jgi:hypothetical protein
LHKNRKVREKSMKYSPNMLDALMMHNDSDELISLRTWIHWKLKFTFLPDVSDNILDTMRDKDLNELVNSLKYF